MLKGVIILTLLLAQFKLSAGEVVLPPHHEQSIGKILVYNGNIEIYSRGFKNAITEGMLPISLYPGDEIKVATMSNCQILLNNNDILNLSSESHIAIDWFNKDILKFFLKYGSFMINTNQEIYIKTRGSFTKAAAGRYVVKYNRVKLQATMFNISGELLVKHENSNKVFKIKNATYLTLFSYSNDISNGEIDNAGIKRLTKLFEINYKPDGKVVQDKKFPGKDLKGASIPFTDSINLDYAKRQSGI